MPLAKIGAVVNKMSWDIVYRSRETNSARAGSIDGALAKALRLPAARAALAAPWLLPFRKRHSLASRRR